MIDNPFHPEGIYACDGCERTYAEYVNGCVYCWDDDLTIEENRRRFPRRKVRLLVPDSGRRDTRSRGAISPAIGSSLPSDTTAGQPAGHLPCPRCGVGTREGHDCIAGP